jgi:hypothetical protein
MNTSFKVTTLIAAISLSIYALTEVAWHFRHLFTMNALQSVQFRDVLSLVNIVALLIGIGFACIALLLYIKTKKV